VIRYYTHFDPARNPCTRTKEEVTRKSPSIPRIKPVDLKTPSEDDRGLVSSTRAVATIAANGLFVLGEHQALMRKWMLFEGRLLYGGNRPPRHRAMLILRTA
jgi:hypothetical protein